jgi:hypothetical protein
MASAEQAAEVAGRARAEVSAAEAARLAAESAEEARQAALAGSGRADPVLSEAEVAQAMADAHSGKTAWAQAALPDGGDGDSDGD